MRKIERYFIQDRHINGVLSNIGIAMKRTKRQVIERFFNEWVDARIPELKNVHISITLDPLEYKKFENRCIDCRVDPKKQIKKIIHDWTGGKGNGF
jgi:hypothetical protein